MKFGILIAWILILPIKFYQMIISPLFPATCRFEPTCSCYTDEAIRTLGVWGAWLSVKRILRCHPWGGNGYDPVPKKNNHQKA